MSKLITADDIPDIATGAAVLGSGGGGDPHIGRLLAEHAIRRNGPVTLLDLDEVPPEAIIIPVAMMGAPTVMVEKIPAAGQLATAVNAIAAHVGVTPAYIGCDEVGGVNSTVPIAAAAELGVPLVDGDMMGRAFPELQMALPSLIGVSASPMSIVDEHGNWGVLSTVDNRSTERLARTLTIEMGSSASISTFVLTGQQARDGYVRGSISLTARIGRALRAARDAHVDPIDAVVSVLGGRRLLDGKIGDVERRTHTGFARGTATVLPEGGTGEYEKATVSFQNENLVAEIDGAVVATTPDLIVFLEQDTGSPITTEAVRYGQRVAVVGIPADARWHTPGGLELVGPRYFGYDMEPVPVGGAAR
jgi:DUF917 family protein